MKKTLCLSALVFFTAAACSSESGSETPESNETTNSASPEENNNEEIEDEEEEETWEAITSYEQNLDNVHYETENSSTISSLFPEDYTYAEGVLTFRGNNLRDSPSFGSAQVEEEKLEVIWEKETGRSEDWGGGAGWTGQPVIVNWDDSIRENMDLHEEKNSEELVEVIQGSLDGNVYFLDLEDGSETRDPIEIGNPIKGSVSLDASGSPILYVGDGVPEGEPFGFRLFDLYTNEKLHFQTGRDDYAYREWAAFDSSALFNREDDVLLTGGENGLLYNVEMNTEHDAEDGTVSVDPEVKTSRYEADDHEYQGIESSLAAYKNLTYFADNSGTITAYDTELNEPVWMLPPLDDTDATIVLEVEEGHPYLYTGSEVDNVEEDGTSYLRKIDGLTGEEVWREGYDAYYYPGVVGGVLATPVVGKDDIDDLIIFTIARTTDVYAGTMVALDKETGEEVWTWEMEDYGWSSPAPVYQEDGPTYLIQGDWQGNLHLLEAATGEKKDELFLGANIEASPAVYDDTIVLGTRADTIFGIKIK
jgi:outer membrane protein assembly factor BamB